MLLYLIQCNSIWATSGGDNDAGLVNYFFPFTGIINRFSKRILQIVILCNFAKSMEHTITIITAYSYRFNINMYFFIYILLNYTKISFDKQTHPHLIALTIIPTVFA